MEDKGFVEVDKKKVTDEEFEKLLSDPNIRLKKLTETSYKTLKKLEEQPYKEALIKLTTDERLVIEKISALSCRDLNTVKEVLKAFLIVTTSELYKTIDEEPRVLIPYICNLKIDYYEGSDGKIKVSLEAEALEALENEVASIVEGEYPPSERFMRRQITKNIANVIDLDDFELEE